MKNQVLGHLESQIQKEIFSFLSKQNNQSIAVPSSLKEESSTFPFVVLMHLLPMMQQVETGLKQKKIISNLLESIFLNSKSNIETLRAIYEQINDDQIQSLSGGVPFSTVLSKLISLSTRYINLISEPHLSQDRRVNIANIQQHTKTLYLNILEVIKDIQTDERVLIINKLIVLGHHQVVLQHMLINNQKEFLLEHFLMFSKQSNLIKFLYKKCICCLKLNQTSICQQMKELLRALGNRYISLESSFVSLLSINSVHLFQGLYYQLYFEIVSTTKIAQNVFLQLLRWWAVGRNYIITDIHAQIRCNLLCLFIASVKKEELVASDYMVSIIEGIKKRLTDGSSKSFALLVWKVLAQTANLPLTEEAEKASYFIIKAQPQQFVKRQPQQNIESMKSKNSNKQGKNTENIEKSENSKQVKDNSNQKLQQKEPVPLGISADKEVIDKSQQSEQIIQIQPKNLYDCILGLRNVHRVKVSLQKLPQLIQKHKEDLVLMWNSLLQVLLSPLKEEYKSVLILLFNTRPEEFIDALTLFFIRKETSLSEKIWLMEILMQGIEQLSAAEINQEKEDDDKEYYFKKVKSKYYSQKRNEQTGSDRQQQKREERTRRWGHTRIEHEQKSKGVNLNIVGNHSHINRFYPIANALYYKIIDPLTVDLINALRKHQVYVQCILRLLSIFTSNIKNHFDKHLLLSDISSVCQKVVEELEDAKLKGSNRYEQSGGQTLMLCLQVVNKMSCVLDRFVSESVMANLKRLIEGARKLPNYGMNPVLDMIEGTIYKNVYQPINSETNDIFI